MGEECKEKKRSTFKQRNTENLDGPGMGKGYQQVLWIWESVGTNADGETGMWDGKLTLVIYQIYSSLFLCRAPSSVDEVQGVFTVLGGRGPTAEGGNVQGPGLPWPLGITLDHPCHQPWPYCFFSAWWRPAHLCQESSSTALGYGAEFWNKIGYIMSQSIECGGA